MNSTKRNLIQRNLIQRNLIQRQLYCMILYCMLLGNSVSKTIQCSEVEVVELIEV